MSARRAPLAAGAATALAVGGLCAGAFAEPPPAQPPVSAPNAEEPIEPQATSKKSAADKLPWTLPGPADPRPPGAAVVPKRLLLTALADVHGFTSGAVRGAASEYRARFGVLSLGITAGVVEPNGYKAFGVDLFRYYGVELSQLDEHTEMRLLFPHVELEMVWADHDTKILHSTVSALGLRVTQFPFAVDVRPTWSLWVPQGASSAPSQSFGLALAGAWELP